MERWISRCAGVAAISLWACVPAQRPLVDTEPAAPVALMVVTPMTAEPGELITADASSSQDADGDIAHYRWNLDDGTTLTSDEPRITHTYVRPGRYTIQVEVVDETGLSDLTFARLEVLGPPPPPTAPPPAVPPAVPPPATPPPSADDAPVITVQPLSQIAAEGTSALLWVVATGRPAPTYQWQKDGVDLAGATTAEHLVGAATSADAGDYTVVVENPAGRVVSAAATLTVTAPPTQTQAPSIISAPPPDGVAGVPWTYAVSATGMPAPSLSITGLPPSGSLVFDGARVQGVPVAADVGAHQVTITATNPQGEDTQAFTLEIRAGAPRITSTAVETAAQGAPYAYQITVIGVPVPSIGVSGLPAGLTFDGASLIAGTPGADDVGEHSVVVTATNTQGADTQTFTLTIVDGVAVDEGFEGAPIGWTATRDWAFGAPSEQPNGPPGGAFEGAGVAGTVLDADYQDLGRSSLDTPQLDLSGVANPALAFAHYYRTELNFDGGNVKVSQDGGATFELVPESAISGGGYTGSLDTRYNNPMSGEPAYSGEAPDWADVWVDLDAVLGAGPRDRVIVRFDFGADSSRTDAGWFIDRVRIDDSAALPPGAPAPPGAPPP